MWRRAGEETQHNSGQMWKKAIERDRLTERKAAIKTMELKRIKDEHRIYASR